MIEIDIEPELIPYARRHAEEIGIRKNSVEHGKANIYGSLSEIIIADYLNGKHRNTFDFDVVKNGFRLEVKGNSTVCKPQKHYDATIWAYNITQQCDYYVFVRVLKNMEIAWIMGTISKKRFFRQARFFEKGDADPKSSVGHRFKGDCFQLPITQLKELTPNYFNRV